MKYSLYVSILLCLFSLLAMGCNRDGKFPVAGTVTWEGEPIPNDHNAHIIFTPVDTSLGPDAVKLEADSTFQFRSTAGEKRIEIFIDRPIGKPDPVMKIQPHEQYIPVRYNEQTELSATVEQGGENRFEFNLTKAKGDVAAGK